ncbi:MAG: hypothetical protein E7044_12575 [Lentisphaerae bacterium]|nr:hypothetical protein [Lentisphaerota bacterium]
MTKRLALLILGAAMLLPLSAKDLYVKRKGGKNTNPGTKEKPFRNLWKAIEKAAPETSFTLPKVSIPEKCPAAGSMWINPFT